MGWRAGLLLSAVAVTAVGVALLRVGAGADADDPGASDSAAAAQREQVQRFWELYRRATAHRVAGRLEEAVGPYREALALNPAHEDALYYLGNTLFELGWPAEAEGAWRRLAEAAPHSARAHAQLGTLYSCPAYPPFMDLAGAAREFQQALAINQEETGPLVRLGQIALLRGAHEDAWRYLDAVTRSHERSVEAHFLKGYVAWQRGDRAEARRLFSAAVRATQARSEPAGVPGEGDTRSGRPLGSRTSCELVPIPLDTLHALGPGKQVPDEEVARHYRALGRWIGRR